VLNSVAGGGAMRYEWRMYRPQHFAVDDPQLVHEALRRYPAAELITLGSDGLEASTVPLLLDVTGTPRLVGHLARANPQWKRFDANTEALAVFRGPDAYVSPGWYPSKAEHAKVVPTWNYITVHARGALVVHDDPVWVEQLVRRLTTEHEATLAQPWSVDDAPATYIDAMVKSIVGIELHITSLEGKWKLSQNRPEPDVAGVVRNLSERSPGDVAVANAIREAAGRT
jgi:transcriptional regulator